MNEIVWYFVGDHGRVAHAFRRDGATVRKRPGDWRDYSYCGIGPAWIEANEPEIGRCKSCLRWIA